MSQDRSRRGFHCPLLLIVVFAGGGMAPSAWTQTPAFAPGTAIGTVDTFDISEASGLVASRQNPGVLWTHNDSTFHGSVFALATNGAYLARLDVPDVYEGDFEDIAIGPGPMPHFQYLYLADIGDNALVRESIRVFRFPEPAVYPFYSNAPVIASTLASQEIPLRYPDGPFDAEAMFVDPITGDLFIATKDTNTCRLYRATRAELDSGEPVLLTFVREVAFRSASAADITPDGSLIAMRRSNRAVLWVRQPGETVGAAVARDPISIPVIGRDATPPEPNGEAIAFDPAASGYFTLSEGFQQPIYHFARTDVSPRPPVVLISPGAEWSYEDGGVPLASTWRTGFNDDWFTGAAPLGYGGQERTPLFGDEFFPTIYFRHVFTNAGTVTNLALRVCFNDGIAVYLNGTEVLRHNLPANATAETFADAPSAGQANYWRSVPVDPALLEAGANLLAAEVHHAEGSFARLNFDLQLLEAAVEWPPRITEVRLTNGVYWAAIEGPAGRRVVLESSSDLRAWHFERLFALTNGAATFSVPATNGTLFFRAGQ